MEHSHHFWELYKKVITSRLTMRWQEFGDRNQWSLLTTNRNSDTWISDGKYDEEVWKVSKLCQRCIFLIDTPDSAITFKPPRYFVKVSCCNHCFFSFHWPAQCGYRVTYSECHYYRSLQWYVKTGCLLTLVDERLEVCVYMYYNYYNVEYLHHVCIVNIYVINYISGDKWDNINRKLFVCLDLGYSSG